MTLSVIIVNYRSATYILNLLRTFYKQQNSFQYEIIIVDNDSADNSEKLILSEFPQVRWIDMGYNAGFARANNKGISMAKGEVVLLLNPDTLIIDNAIERCFKKFVSTSHVACGVQLLYEDKTPQISGNFFMKGGLNHLLPLPYWGNLLRSVAFLFKAKKTNVLEASLEEKVDWISGAFLMVKKEAIRSVGFMDEDFFLYAEEVEWCSRLKKAGDLVIFGDIHVIHILGEAIKSATKTEDKGYSNLYDKKGLQLIVSNHVRIRKQYGLGWFLFQLINFTLAIPVFFIIGMFDNFLHGRQPFKHWKALRGLFKNVANVWKLSPLIIRNKPHFYKML